MATRYFLYITGFSVVSGVLKINAGGYEYVPGVEINSTGAQATVGVEDTEVDIRKALLDAVIAGHPGLDRKDVVIL